MTSDEIADALDSADGGPPETAPRPKERPGPAASWREAFDARTVEMEGGHLHWTGSTGERGTPLLGHRGQIETAYRLAFRWHHQRKPEGNVRPTCDYPCCVAGAHLADRRIRGGGA